MMKKISVIFISIILIVSIFTVPVFADSYGSKTTIDMRWDSAFSCIAPTDTTYYFYYIISGETGDFNWIGNKYVLIWSKDRLVVEGNTIQMTSPFYYVSASTLETLVTGLTTDRTSLEVYQSAANFEFRDTSNFQIHYSNQKYFVDGVAHSPHWVAAVAGSQTEALSKYLSSVYSGLKNINIKVFGTEISAIVFMAGPFLISFTIMILQMIIGVGDSAATHSVAVGVNVKKKVQESRNKKNKEKEERNRQGK